GARRTPGSPHRHDSRLLRSGARHCWPAALGSIAMTIVSHEGQHQVCCDSCPASYPNTYASEDWDVMISDARTAGWIIRKAKPPASQRDTSDLFGSAPRVA